MDWPEQKLYVLKRAVMTEELWVVVRKDGYAANRSHDSRGPITSEPDVGLPE